MILEKNMLGQLNVFDLNLVTGARRSGSFMVYTQYIM